MPSYEVGKKYKVLDALTFDRLALSVADGSDTFTCHKVDKDGDCYSDDLAFYGEVCGDGEGWCLGLWALKDDVVVEV